MANRSLRRPVGKSVVFTDIAGEPEQRTVDGVSGDEGTEPDADRSADADDRNTHVESDSVERIRVVEIAPERLSDFIAERAAERDNGSDNGNGNGERRTRKPRAAYGSKKRGKEKNQNIEPLITMVHTWGAILLKTPELMLTETESKKLSESYAMFCEHHEVPVLTEKRMSEINLCVAVLSIYGPRLVAVKNRKKNERGNGNVTQMPQRGVVNH